MEAPKQKKIGAGVGLMLMRDRKILLGLRHADPAKAGSELHGGGTWTMPGGKLDFGESFESGAARELLEETGITVDPKDMKVISLANDIVEDAHFVTIGLFADKFEGEAKIMEPDEITEWGWFALDSLPQNLFFPSREVLENYQKGLFYAR